MPDDPQLVVTNTTPIIALSLLNKLSFLQSLYDTGLIPPTVQAEVIAGGTSNIGVTELQDARR